MKKLLGIVVLLVMIVSHSFAAKKLKVYIDYPVYLVSVESPTDAKKQFADTQIKSINDSINQVTKYMYEDDYIKIILFKTYSSIAFDLTNKTDHPIKLNWDNFSYVNTEGKTIRVIHSGVKYIDRNNSQPASVIPKGASISDVLMPAENVYLIGSTWNTGELLPFENSYKTENLNYQPTSIKNWKQMSLYMPIEIEGVQNDYTFHFFIDKIERLKTKK